MKPKKSSVPVQKSVNFELDAIIFNSNFDSGNLARVEKIGKDFFRVYAGTDCYGTKNEQSFRSWFHFSIRAPVRSHLTIVIRGLMVTPKLFREGMRPVYRLDGSDKWVRVQGNMAYNYNIEGSYDLLFTFIFSSPLVFFAFTYPWSYQQGTKLLTRMLAHKQTPKQLYYHRENLINSVDGRRCDILTISSTSLMRTSRESNIAALYPNVTEYRAFEFDPSKRMVFITARVHPGETQGSFVCNGILKFLLSPDPRAQLLRDNFVFKIVPMVNPDGVHRGNFRTDQNGINLNRVYGNPSSMDHPTVYAIKRLFVHYAKKSGTQVYCYFDLHGHTSKKGCFVYGNTMDFPSMVDAMVIPKLCELNCANFDFRGSDFTETNLAAEYGSKDGCARVALYKATGLHRCYTVECNYNTSIRVNPLAETGLSDGPFQDTTSDVYIDGVPTYTPELFEDVGKAICISILDSTGKNPYTRVKNTVYVNLNSIRYELA